MQLNVIPKKQSKIIIIPTTIKIFIITRQPTALIILIAKNQTRQKVILIFVKLDHGVE